MVDITHNSITIPSPIPLYGTRICFASNVHNMVIYVSAALQGNGPNKMNIVGNKFSSVKTDMQKHIQLCYVIIGTKQIVC